MKLFIVRHGQTESNRLKIYAGQSDEPLENEGISQAHVVGQALSGEQVSAVYSSPVRRALQTAQIIAGHFKNLEVKAVEGLREMAFGPWEGLSEDEVSRRYPNEWQMWLSRPAQLELRARETLAQVQRRAVRAISTITEEIKQDAIVVTHVAVIRCLLLYYNGIELDRYKTIAVPNGSIFRLNADHGQGRGMMKEWSVGVME